MVTQYDKAIATAVISIVALLALVFHWSIPGWFTETNILEFLSVVVPMIVAIVPNKATNAQKAEATNVAMTAVVQATGAVVVK